MSEITVYYTANAVIDDIIYRMSGAELTLKFATAKWQKERVIAEIHGYEYALEMIDITIRSLRKDGEKVKRRTAKEIIQQSVEQYEQSQKPSE